VFVVAHSPNVAAEDESVEKADENASRDSYEEFCHLFLAWRKKYDVPADLGDVDVPLQEDWGVDFDVHVAIYHLLWPSVCCDRRIDFDVLHRFAID